MRHGRAEHLRVVGEHQATLEELSQWRGISIETLLEAGIYRDGIWWKIPYPHMTGVWYERGRLAEGLEPPPGKGKYDSPRKAQPHLYNPLKLGPNADEVWFCEGEFDTLALIDAGVPAIGYPGVKTIVEHDDAGDGDRQDEMRFRRSWKMLFDHCTVVAAGDMDTEGKKAIRGILRAFRPNSYHFRIDENFDDINDWWLGDPGGLSRAIDEFRHNR